MVAADEVQDDVDVADGRCEVPLLVIDRFVDTELPEERVFDGPRRTSTYAPRALAIWTARCPMPPAAA